MEPSSNSQFTRVSDNVFISTSVFESELQEVQEICLGLLRLPEEYGQRESFGVFRKGSREVS